VVSITQFCASMGVCLSETIAGVRPSAFGKEPVPRHRDYDRLRGKAAFELCRDVILCSEGNEVLIAV
jgi:hypothetical protein